MINNSVIINQLPKVIFGITHEIVLNKGVVGLKLNG